MIRQWKPLVVAGVVASLAAVSAVASAKTEALSWQPCPNGGAPLECTSVTVPVDWRQPDGPGLALRVARLPATGRRLGAVFANPGGPGVSGVRQLPGMAGKFGAAVRESYDIVSWDPRGIGES